MEKVTGEVNYDVTIKCPSCKITLELNQFPYGEDDEGMLLGKTIFGSNTVPAKWAGIDLKYKCVHCGEVFILNALEY